MPDQVKDGKDIRHRQAHPMAGLAHINRNRLDEAR